LRRAPGVALELKRSLKSIPGVNLIQTNTVTGSLVIFFDNSRTKAEAIISFLTYNGYFNADQTITSQKYVEQKVKKVGETVSKALLGIVLDRALQGTPLSMLTVLI
jgi:hypothetical protein